MNEEKLFHIGISREEGAAYAILPGDPGRVALIASFIDHAKPLAQNREFTSYAGSLCGERVLVLSTGIGGPSAAIALEELAMAGVKYAVRIGTCGGMQEDVLPGDVIVPTAAVRMEGTSREYAPPEFPAAADFSVVSALVQAAHRSGCRCHTGIVQSKDSFYGQHMPQSMPVAEELLRKWQAWKQLGVLASEMECAALFTVAAARGVRMGSILHCQWNQERAAKGLSDTADFSMEQTIEAAVTAMKRLILAHTGRPLPPMGRVRFNMDPVVREKIRHFHPAVSGDDGQNQPSAEKGTADPITDSRTADDNFQAEAATEPMKEYKEETEGVSQPVPGKKLLAIVGPTASGKTALAIQLAKKYNGEIISADSMQIYKGMDIVSAKPTEAEKEGIPHHLMDFLSPSDTFSVSEYVRLARDVIDDILSRGKLPILCGGTGLYERSLIENINFPPEEPNEALRQELNERFEKEGGEALLRELAEFDPESAERLEPNNGKRIIRAIEVYRTTGVTMSEQLRRSRSEPSPYDVTAIGLTFADRQQLYDRINKRVDLMIRMGLVEEARAFYSSEKSVTSSAAIGYKELKPYLDGKMSLEACVEKLKMETRRFAKRQLTWFNREAYIHWIEVDRCEDVLEEAVRIACNGILGGQPESDAIAPHAEIRTETEQNHG